MSVCVCLCVSQMQYYVYLNYNIFCAASNAIVWVIQMWYFVYFKCMVLHLCSPQVQRRGVKIMTVRWCFILLTLPLPVTISWMVEFRNWILTTFRFSAHSAMRSRILNQILQQRARTCLKYLPLNTQLASRGRALNVWNIMYQTRTKARYIYQTKYQTNHVSADESQTQMCFRQEIRWETKQSLRYMADNNKARCVCI